MLTWLLLACTGDTTETTDSVPETVPDPLAVAPSVLPAPERLVGFADVHGDLQATLDVLQLADLTDADGHWIGGETVVVQTGDQLDRGDDEQAILDLFEQLRTEAAAAGGGFHPLLGNHETMNVQWDFRYVTDGGWADFADTPHDTDDPALAELEPEHRGRAAAFMPGGPYALVLATHNLTMQVGGTVFVHGGILPVHAEAGLETINADVQAWMRGDAEAPDDWISGEAPVWTRLYSDEEDPACDLLEEALATLGADRMVVGHTVQDRPNPDCDDQVWRMDVGMADYYGGTSAAVEVRGDVVTLLE
jgi:hypothetical protein